METIILTENDKNEIRREIAHTKMIIAKELNYSDDLRDNEYLARYIIVLAKLESSLETGVIIY